ncbi:MAG TPA: hypothetical protein VGE74_14665 [Gemmata sp.]
MIGLSSLSLQRLPAPVSQPRPQNRSHGSKRSTTARRAVFSGAAALVVATVGFAVALDTALPTVRYPEHGYRVAALQKLRAQHPDRPLAVVIGSSRTQMGLDPAAMGFEGEPGAPIVFNYGLIGALPVHHPLGYRRLRAAGVRPDIVVVEIFPALLHIRDASETLYAANGASLTGAELLRLSPDTHDPRIARTWAESRCLAWHWFGPEVQQQASADWLPEEVNLKHNLTWVPDRFGFRPSVTNQITDEGRQRATEKATRLYQPVCHSLRVHPMAERAYRELVTACRADGIPVAFFLSPEAPLFHSWYTPEARAGVAAFVRTLTDELGAPVFDVSDGWDEMDFADGHHLLPPGAAKFSRRFAAQHLRPWFRSVPPGRP